MRNGKAVAETASVGALERREALSGKDVALFAAEVAIEKKAEDPILIDLGGRSSIADYFLLLSGASDRQVGSITDAIVSRLKERQVRVRGVEGGETSQWVLIDAGDTIVHVFHADARGSYDLDGLWADAKRVELSV